MRSQLHDTDRPSRTRPADANPTLRTRREPPRFRPATVRDVTRLSPRLVGVTIAGTDLQGLTLPQPAGSVRLLLPGPGEALVIPDWRGNEFLLPDGRRPTIRTLTPRRSEPLSGRLDLEIVAHGEGTASNWAETAGPGDRVAVSGPGRGYVVDREAPAFLLAGDETALPAIGQLLEALPDHTPVQVLVEVAHPDGRLPLPPHSRATVDWFDRPPGAPPGEALVAAVVGADIAAGTRVWAAGEAAAVQRIRHHLFEERGVPRAHASVRGYWKHGRRAAGEANGNGNGGPDRAGEADGAS